MVHSMTESPALSTGPSAGRERASAVGESQRNEESTLQSARIPNPLCAVQPVRHAVPPAHPTAIRSHRKHFNTFSQHFEAFRSISKSFELVLPFGNKINNTLFGLTLPFVWVSLFLSDADQNSLAERCELCCNLSTFTLTNWLKFVGKM